MFADGLCASRYYLRQIAACHNEGKEQPIDWDAAKRGLRNRAE
jgi:hypothetical protein